jgi:hypothetical protein
MKIFVGGCTGPFMNDVMVQKLTVNIFNTILFTFAYNDKIINMLNFFQNENKLQHIIIDSGAFSVWKSNKIININEYIYFCEKIKNTFSKMCIDVVNLDAIPGIYGKKPSKIDINNAVKNSLNNFELMKNANLNPIYVFHQHEPFDVLKDIISDKTNTYIGLSPANDSHQNEKLKFLDTCFSIVKNNVKCHGFAVTAKDSMLRYPWYSVDSASIYSIFFYGHSAFSKEKLHNRIPEHQLYTYKQDLKELKKLEIEITKIWEKRGILWNN